MFLQESDLFLTDILDQVQCVYQLQQMSCMVSNDHLLHFHPNSLPRYGGQSAAVFPDGFQRLRLVVTRFQSHSAIEPGEECEEMVSEHI